MIGEAAAEYCRLLQPCATFSFLPFIAYFGRFCARERVTAAGYANFPTHRYARLVMVTMRRVSLGRSCYGSYSKLWQ